MSAAVGRARGDVRPSRGPGPAPAVAAPAAPRRVEVGSPGCRGACRATRSGSPTGRRPPRSRGAPPPPAAAHRPRGHGCRHPRAGSSTIPCVRSRGARSRPPHGRGTGPGRGGRRDRPRRRERASAAQAAGAPRTARPRRAAAARRSHRYPPRASLRGTRGSRTTSAAPAPPRRLVGAATRRTPPRP